MAESNRRSSRRIQGLQPEPLDEVIRQRRQQQVVNPPVDESVRGAIDDVDGAGFIAGGEGHLRGSNTPSDDAQSVSSGISTASSIRRRQREAQLREAEELARLGTQRDQVERRRLEQEAEVERRRLEREAELIRLRAQVERDNLQDDMEDLADLEGRSLPGNAMGIASAHQGRERGPTANWVATGGATMASAEDRNDVGMASFPEERRAPAISKEDSVGGRVRDQTGQDSSGGYEGDSIGRLADILTKELRKDKITDNRHFLARQTIGRDKLPEFHGDPSDWPTFFAQFTSSSEECGFTPTEDLMRLRRCLKGKAKDSVQGLLVSPDNLHEIIETLKVNFGRKEMIIWNLIDKAKRVPPPREEDYNSILTFSNAVGNLCATIKTLENKTHLQNPQLLRDLVEKLTPTMKYDWAKHTACDEEVNLDDFADWLKRITRALGSTAVASFVTRRKENAFHLEETGEKICSCCGINNHKIQECRKFRKLKYDAKQKIVMEKKLCFICLESGHRSRECPSKKKCSKEGCEKWHHPLLHKYKDTKFDKEPKQEEKEEESFMVKGKSAQLAIIPVIVSGPTGEIETYACLDEGTTSTYIEAELAGSLGLCGTPDPVTVSMMDGNEMCFKDSKRVTFHIKGSYTDARQNLVKGARTVTEIGIGEQSLDFPALSKMYGYLEGLPVSSYSNVKPRLLVGQADKLLTLARKHAHGKYGEPVAYKTWLGWVVSGKFGSRNEENSALISENNDNTLHQLVKSSFAIDALGIQVFGENSHSKEDKRAMEIMKNTTRRVGDQFETGLLWRNDKVSLPSSYLYAFSRLKGQERKMDREPAFAQAMCAKMDEYLTKGYIRKLHLTEVTKVGKTWYLPYFGVYNPNKPGKMRLVFDAAAKCNGISLNSTLLQGPDYLNPLLSVLWKFRERKIAFGADITDMYHRIKIIEDDLPAQRFLWRGMDRQKQPDVYQINVMIFGASCSPSSAMYVKNQNAMEFKEEFPEACTAIHDNFYMDDYLDCVDTEEQATKKIHDVIEVNKRGGFVLCKWISNSKVVLKNIPVELRAEGFKEVDMKQTELPVGRALGVWWNPENDSFCFKLNLHKVPQDVKGGTQFPTKRQALALVMSVFDPLGLVAHVTVKSRILLQDIWRSCIHWDDVIPEDFHERWTTWLQQLNEIQSVEVPRCYSVQIPAAKSIQLHVFCDASAKAYCSVAYLRVEGAKSVDVVFVAAKTRVTPLKEQPMPRLQAALMGSRLASSIKKNHNLKINDLFMWTDSSTVMHWINSESRRFTQFISHRLGEILELTEASNWNWVPTKENVADDATRDIGPADVSLASRWFCGPAFLRFLRINPLPIPFESKKPLVNEANLELKKEHVNLLPEVANGIINFKNYSSLRKIQKVVCWMNRWKSKVRGPLEVEELENAEIVLVKLAQRESFPKELKNLREGKPVGKQSKLANLSPFLDKSGIIRMKSRLVNADFLPNKTKYPILLDSAHQFSSLVIGHYHEKWGHRSSNTVINQVREKYWITAIGSAVRKYIFNCQLCKNRRAVPQVPEMGNLPVARITPHCRPFTYTGMDVFGPYEVIVKRSRVKRYGLLFTCLTVRAVHIEKLDNLSTDSCIMAIDRFSAIRGRPKEIYCDNGTNFRGAEKELAKYLKEEETKDKMLARGIKFKFNPPAAPHFGGAWERLVRSIKTAMGSTMKQRTMSDEVLLTIFQQAMGLVNSRPLTEISVDPVNPVMLTPNHFLFGPNFEPEDMSGLTFNDEDLQLRRHWRFAQRLCDHFWNRWIREYLPVIMRRSKWHGQAKKIEVGDIVVVHDNTVSRDLWKLGRVVAVYPSQDGNIRVADVVFNGTIYKRSVSNLAIQDVKKVDD